MRTKEEIVKYFREADLPLPKAWGAEFIRGIENTNPEYGDGPGIPFEEYVDKHYPGKILDIVLDQFPQPPCKYVNLDSYIHDPMIEKWRVMNQRYIDWLKGYPDTAKWVYRLESTKPDAGLWYDSRGKWCRDRNGIGNIPGCETWKLPMGYDARYKKGGRDWFSSCSRLEDLSHWYSKRDAERLLRRGFVFTRYLATEYYEYPLETTFIPHTSLAREVIDLYDIWPPAEISLETLEKMEKRCQQGKHRWRKNEYGAWCSVCGLYGGPFMAVPDSDPNAPDLLCKINGGCGNGGSDLIIKG